MGEDDINNVLAGFQSEIKELQTKNLELTTSLSANTYNQQQDNNLIQYQLDTGEMLNKIEHFLKGETISLDNEGNECWTKQTNKDLILFNEYGVNSIMLIIGNYIEKNTFLSFYDEMRINQILSDLGDELSNFIFCNYEKMGMDTEFKKTRYALTVINILHSIESAYRRAIRGRTSEDLNTSRIFTQHDNLQRGGNAISPKKFSIFNPKSW